MHQPNSKPLGQPPSILVVDDDPEMRALLSDALQQDAAYHVVTARDGTEALVALRHRAFDVVVLDQNLPGASGLDLLPDLRRVAPQARVILITAFGDVASYLEALEQGAVEYLFKPFSLTDIKTAIARVLLQASGPTPRSCPCPP